MSNRQACNESLPSSSAEPADTALVRLGQRLRESGYRFITPTPLTHERVNAREHNRQARSLRDVFGWNRPFEPSLIAPELDLMSQADMIEERDGLLQSKVRWSSLDDLLLVHSGFPTTAQDSVFFGPDTYRFAKVIEAHLQSSLHPIKRAADIGCGTGAGALLIARARRDAQVLALDINPGALRLARINTSLAGLENVNCQRSDVLQDVEGSFDLIVANPPYMQDPDQRAYRHGGDALGADLSLRIVEESLPRLTLGGSLLLYTGVAIVEGEDPFLNTLRGRLDTAGLSWRYEELDPDVFGEELLTDSYARVDRIAVVALTVTRLG